MCTAQVSLVWVLGHFAADIPEAPYLLETMIDGCGESQKSPTSAIKYTQIPPKSDLLTPDMSTGGRRHRPRCCGRSC